MAYSSKVKAEAKKLYTIDGLSFEKIAKKLKIAERDTVQKWSKTDPEGEWIEKRAEIKAKVGQITDEVLTKEFGIDQAKIKQANIEATNEAKLLPRALIQYANHKLLDPVTGQLKPGALQDPEFPYLLNIVRIMEPRLVNSAKAQDDIAFNKNKIDVNANVNFDTSGLYKAAIEKAQSSLNPDRS